MTMLGCKTTATTTKDLKSWVPKFHWDKVCVLKEFFKNSLELKMSWEFLI